MTRARRLALSVGLSLCPALLFLGAVGLGRQSADVGGRASWLWPALGFLAAWLLGVALVRWLLVESRHARAAVEEDLLAREREQQQDLLTFSRRAAHDLQNPVTVIQGWAAELGRCLADDPFAASAGAPAMVERIEATAAQMRSLIVALLADATARDRVADRASVDLAGLARKVAEQYHGRATITVHDVGVVQGDAVLLGQVVENVVGNAVKYVPRGERAEVEITGRRSGGQVVMRVADRGIGVPDGLHEEIFNEFARAHAASYPGTGLGLSICRRIVERLGGTIRALDRDDGLAGTLVEIALPAARTPAVAGRHALALRYSPQHQLPVEIET